MSDSLDSGGSGRREFLKNSLRTVLFGGFVLTGLHLATRSGSEAGGSACPVSEACGRCSRLPKCGDLRAVRYKSSTVDRDQPDEQTKISDGNDR